MPRPLLKKELLSIINDGFDERRAAAIKRRARNNEMCKRWRVCEKAINAAEQKLGRPLTVREYYQAKIDFGINPWNTKKALQDRKSSQSNPSLPTLHPILLKTKH